MIMGTRKKIVQHRVDQFGTLMLNNVYGDMISRLMMEAFLELSITVFQLALYPIHDYSTFMLKMLMLMSSNGGLLRLPLLRASGKLRVRVQK